MKKLIILLINILIITANLNMRIFILKILFNLLWFIITGTKNAKKLAKIAPNIFISLIATKK